MCHTEEETEKSIKNNEKIEKNSNSKSKSKTK